MSSLNTTNLTLVHGREASRHGGPDALGIPRWDFSTNANAAAPLPGWTERLAEVDPSRYPDPGYAVLRERLAELHGVAPGRIVPAASASEFISRITTAVALAQPRAVVQVPVPGYGDYGRAARAVGLRTVGYGVDEGVQLTHVKVVPALAWHAEPGSPGGDCAAPPVPAASTVLVVDRAYAPLRLEGTAAPLPATAWQLWSPNKALGLTGVRGAYAIAPAAAVEPGHAQDTLRLQLEALAPSWPLGAHGVAMLMGWTERDTQAAVQASLTELRRWKARQLAVYAELGWEARHSVTPYGLVRWPGSEDDAARERLLGALRERGLKLRDASSLGASGWLRLSVQCPEAQQALADAWHALQGAARREEA